MKTESELELEMEMEKEKELELLEQKIDDAYAEFKDEVLNKELDLEEIDSIAFDTLYKRDLVDVNYTYKKDDLEDLGCKNYFINDDWIENKNEFVFAYCFFVKNEYDDWEERGFNCNFKIKEDMIIENGKYGVRLKKDTKAIITEIGII